MVSLWGWHGLCVYHFPMNAYSHRKRKSCQGATLVEAIIAAAVLAVALAGICVTNWRTIHVLYVDKQQAAASYCLQQRVEQLRNGGWTMVTSGSSVQALFNTQPSAASNIPGFAEEVSINSYPTPAGTAIDVSESAANTATLNTNNTTFASGATGSMVKVDLSITWPNYYGPTHQRTVTTIISNGGIQ